MNTVQSGVLNNADLPPELLAKPLALVGISGLDIVNNAVHKSIWETFSSNRRIERHPVLFKLISNSHEFPVIKPKRNSYDWYIPKGIIKRNWMNKHLYEIPAVIVIFYDLDWNDAHWNEKLIECSSRVQSMRAALEGRNTRLCIVLMQSSLPLPAGEDILASERAASLCSSCEISSSCLFVLPHGDHLQGYAIRLETAFYEFAQNYYYNEAKNVKSHKDHLNKNNHQYLLVRHQFKMGFLNEMKQDPQSALKHYTYAYNNLLEIRITESNALEVRTVAGFIIYKLCHLMFILNMPRDAITQFKNHIETFKNRLGPPELVFEHYAWLAKQYAVFGDVFDEAVKLGLPAVQIQHPGIYYHQAAHYAVMRKKFSEDICSKVVTYPNPNPFQGISYMEFFGQRPWRIGKITEASDPQLEADGIRALQYLEKQVNHSAIIISLFGLAISQYKNYKCPRMRRHLVLQMADEYYYSKDFGKALTLLAHMLGDFRAEKWWKILSNILGKALTCAFLTANIQDYLLLAIESLGSHIELDLEYKRRINEDLNRILKKQIPYGEPSLSHDILQNAIINWQPIFPEQPVSFQLDLSEILCCIQTKARFLKPAYEIDQNVIIEVYIKSTSPFTMNFEKVSVNVNTPAFTREFAVANGENSLSFQSNEIKHFLIEFTADPSDINKEIQIGAINMQYGSLSECFLDLKFASGSPKSDVYPELLHFKIGSGDIDFYNIKSQDTALIVPRVSKLRTLLEFDHPALVGEWFEVTLRIDNEEEYDLSNFRAEVNLIDEETGDIEFSLSPSGALQKLPLSLDTPKTAPKGKKFDTNFFLRAHKIGEKSIQIKLIYTLNSEQPVVSIKSEVLNLRIVQPFEVKTKFISMLMNDIHKIYVDEDFGLMTTIDIISPCPIVIENTTLEFVAPVKSAEEEQSCEISGNRYERDETASELYLATCEKLIDRNSVMAHYTIHWRRENGKIVSTSKSTVFGVDCEWLPLDIRVSLPAHGLVRTPMIVSYHVKNRSQHLIQLDVSMEATESFMFAGYKKFSVSFLPKSTRILQYNLYPLRAGSVFLPRLNLTVPENSTEGPILRQDQVRDLLERSLPTHLYVMPQIKGNPIGSSEISVQ